MGEGILHRQRGYDPGDRCGLFLSDLFHAPADSWFALDHHRCWFHALPGLLLQEPKRDVGENSGLNPLFR